MIVAYIDAHKARFGVEPIAAVLTEHGVPIAPSTYYERTARPVTTAQLDDAYALDAWGDVWRANRGLHGLRKCWHAVHRAGHEVGRDQVGRSMTIAGIEVVRRDKRTTRTTAKDATAARHPDLVARAWATPTAPDQWWIADFT